MIHKFIKWLQSLAKEKPRHDVINDHSDNLLKSIMFETTTEYQILLFDELKLKFDNSLHKHDSWAKQESMLINKYKREQNNVNSINVIDAVFENPIPNNIHKLKFDRKKDLL